MQEQTPFLVPPEPPHSVWFYVIGFGLFVLAIAGAILYIRWKLPREGSDLTGSPPRRDDDAVQR